MIKIQFISYNKDSSSKSTSLRGLIVRWQKMSGRRQRWLRKTGRVLAGMFTLTISGPPSFFWIVFALSVFKGNRFLGL